MTGRRDGAAEQIAGYFDGRQVDPAAFVGRTAGGHEELANAPLPAADAVDKAPTPEAEIGANVS